MDNARTRKNYSSYLMGKSPGKSPYRNHNDTESSTMYLDYPPTKPFINEEYERPPYKPVSSYPEGNRTAVISALKNLQGKIHQLEVERSAAEDNLKSLATETNKYRDVLQKESEQRKPSQTTVSKHNQELESQLSAAETRCDLLEKQLDYMRNMVGSAEKDRIDAVRKSAELEVMQEPPEYSSTFQHNLRKIADLEREHIKLTANQSVAESKIRELEEKLGDERHHRKIIVEKAVEIESVQKANRILQEADEMQEYKLPQKSKRPGKKKKKSVVSKKTAGHCNKSEAAKHYRLNLADIPFVAGKNTGPSHSVGANVQRVFSLMKSHNMALCSQASSQVSSCQQGSSRRSSSESSSPSTDSELAEILLQLQDEFHQMSFEHQELSKEINEASDHRIRDDMERELDGLVSRMEAKSLQISKIRRHQERLASRKKKKTRKSDEYDETSTPRPRTTRDCLHASPSPRYSGEVEVTTTIKPKGAGSGVVQIRPSSAREISLNVLKDMKKLQSTLRKDDLSWK